VAAAAPSFYWLVVGQAIVGIGVAGHHPAHYPLLTDATPEAVRGRAFSVYNVGGTFGFATPPVVITAVMGSRASPGATPSASSGSWAWDTPSSSPSCSPAASTRRSQGPNVTESTGSGSATERVRSELGSLLADPAILVLAALAPAASTANWGLSSYAVVFLTDTYAVSLDRANLALTGLFLTGAVGVLVGGSLTDRFSPAPVLLGSFVGLTALVALIATGYVLALAAVGLFLPSAPSGASKALPGTR